MKVLYITSYILNEKNKNDIKCYHCVFESYFSLVSPYIRQMKLQNACSSETNSNIKPHMQWAL